MAVNEQNAGTMSYPLTKMNFLVTIDGSTAGAAFTEVTGVEASVDVIEFRQGNSNSLAPIKIPGLVKHGNVTLKMGYIMGSEFKQWIMECVSERRKAMPRKTVTIELINIQGGAPDSVVEASVDESLIWTLKEAWVTKYSGVDLNASASEVAIETVELAYEELLIAQ